MDDKLQNVKILDREIEENLARIDFVLVSVSEVSPLTTFILQMAKRSLLYDAALQGLTAPLKCRHK